jgi:hypothetical protein
MTLKSQMQEDAMSVFLNLNDFAEIVVYYPRGGGARQIRAIVNRDPPSFYDSTGAVVAVSFMIYVANDSTTGIAGTEIDTGGDRVAVARREGAVNLNQRVIWQVMNQDLAMMQLALK